MSKDLDGIGNRLYRARIDAKLTQQQLDSTAGLDQSSIAMIEKGVRRGSAKTISRLAEALAVDVGWLLEGDEHQRLAQSYAHVELMGHVDLGICKIREVDSLGGKSLEVTELLKDGSDGVVRLVEKAALYMRTAVSKEEAMKDAAERWRPEKIDKPVPPAKGDSPIPWASIVEVLRYLGPAETGSTEHVASSKAASCLTPATSSPSPGNWRRGRIRVVPWLSAAEWYDAVGDDIPFQGRCRREGEMSEKERIKIEYEGL